MRSTARFFAVVSIFCCLIANWAAAQAQEFLRGSGDVPALPSNPGISGKGSATDLLPGPAIEPALPPMGPMGLMGPMGRPLNFTEQFTLGGAQNSVTLGNTRSSAIFAGENPSSDKSCLTARAFARPDIANKNLNQNWISAKNSCGRFIKIRVCYNGSVNCISIGVAPSQTKSAIIGYAPTANPIHYQISLVD